MSTVLRAQKCSDCGAMMLGGLITEQGRLAFHGARGTGDIGITCRHDVSWLRDCLDRPVPPICCRHPPCPISWPSCRHGTAWSIAQGYQFTPPGCCRHPPCALTPSRSR